MSQPYHESVIASIESAGCRGPYRPMFIRFVLDEIQRTVIPGNHAEIKAAIDKVIKADACPKEYDDDRKTVFKYLDEEKKKHDAAKKGSTSLAVFTLADGVGTTKIVGPFPNHEAASKWRKKFWRLFDKRFGVDRIVPIDQIRTFKQGDKLISPEEFIESIPDQESEAEFFL